MKKTIYCKKIVFKEGWKENVTLELENGKIESISFDPVKGAKYEDIYIPGFQNAHSHSFQYAMAGLAENHSAHNSDDFWSWRDAMYNLALQLTPDQFEVVATQLYTEMLKHGWTHVAEFHYLHHDKNGNPFANLAEMGERLVAAASKTGMNITLIPIFYQKGGFGKEPSSGQKRFISPTLDAYMKLFESSKKATLPSEFSSIGIGVHSLRGVDPVVVKELTQMKDENLPFHIHISEQLKEVEDALQYLKKRPVEWLMENCDVNDNYHLVHATHLTPQETKDIAESNANVVLCPSTEGNLGDGIFPLLSYQKMNGNWSIGTDSHIGLNPLEELRILDYGQRLISHKRTIFIDEKCTKSGEYALKQSFFNGAKATGRKTEDYFSKGEYFNAVVIDENHPLIASSSTENLLSTLVYAGDKGFIKKVITHGKIRVENGHSPNENSVAQNFIETLKKLKIR